VVGGNWRKRLQKAVTKCIRSGADRYRGERKNFLNLEINLDTHIQHLIGINDEYRSGRTSYGGMVITGVADRVPEKFASLVYLDSGCAGAGLHDDNPQRLTAHSVFDVPDRSGRCAAARGPSSFKTLEADQRRRPPLLCFW
jgi:hypothetical protein